MKVECAATGEVTHCADTQKMRSFFPWGPLFLSIPSWSACLHLLAGCHTFLDSLGPTERQKPLVQEGVSPPLNQDQKPGWLAWEACATALI